MKTKIIGFEILDFLKYICPSNWTYIITVKLIEAGKKLKLIMTTLSEITVLFICVSEVFCLLDMKRILSSLLVCQAHSINC